MNKISLRDSMICPCCGESREINSSECASCGAKQVGPPLAKPDVLMPKLGPSFAALACGVIVIISFLLAWAFDNDIRVGRMLLVWMLGDGYELTKKLLEADAKLPYYRIFAFDAYILANNFSLVAVPLSLAGIWLARRALRLIKSDSASFGGIKVARASYCLSIGLLVVFSAVSVSSIPRGFARRRAKKVAATRALMYELHSRGLQRYYKEYSNYPGELADLSRVNASGAPQSDYWERNFEYKPVAVIASKGSGISLSDYKLISSGPDGKFGTEDDITMIDGVIIESQNDPDAAEPSQGQARQ
ncbi:MAG TPA: hypothetical protein VJZ77_22175 [Blastocatellia bacterium]|nr:hypothetical protein [Blastocatellia bacterium]